MNVTLSLDEKLIKQIRKIAVDMDTTLTGLIRSYLERLAEDHAASGKKRRERERLENTFSAYKLQSRERRWTRDELHERR
jgi:hypothetical protein